MIEQFITNLSPALSDIPLTVIVVLVVGGIVYRILASNSKSSDHMYKLFERNITALDKLDTSINAQIEAQREIADNSRAEFQLMRKEVIAEIRLTEARLLVAIRESRDGKTILADRVSGADAEVRSEP